MGNAPSIIFIFNNIRFENVVKGKTMKYSYPIIIKKYLEQQGGWVLGNSLNNINTDFGFLPPRGQRTAREMARRKEIEVGYFEKNGKNRRRLVYYKTKPEDRLIKRVEEINNTVHTWQ